jgi:tryptophan 7-halogenase
MSDRAIRSVAVAGGGVVGLSAALAFRRSLPNATITVVDVPVDPAALADLLPVAWPSILQFHALIGLDERNLLERGIALHHVGTIFEDWPSGRNWVHGFGPHGKPVGAVHFDQIWLRALNAGNARPYEDYSAAEVLARAGKFVHPTRDTNSLVGTFQYGLRLDPDRYRERLREQAARVGIHFVGGALRTVQKNGFGKIAAVTLADGTMIEADLFIDCTGPAGLLIRELNDSFEEWEPAADRFNMETSDAVVLSPVARFFTTRTGWRAEWPLPNRVLRFDSGSDHPEAISLRSGRRLRPWMVNVLALGDAAAAFPPLYGLNLALVHRAIFLAIELLPDRNFNLLELAEFNRRWMQITDQVRDLVALFYYDPTDFPESLRRRVDQYGQRGRLPYQEDAVLNRDDWTAALIGIGTVPRNVDPTAAGVPLDRATEAMNRIADELVEFAAGAPAYPQYLERIMR